MKFFKKKFRDRQEETVNVVATWEVRWDSRHGEYSYSTRPEIRVFVSEKEALEFKMALDDAFKLIKHTSGKRVEIKPLGEE